MNQVLKGGKAPSLPPPPLYLAHISPGQMLKGGKAPSLWLRNMQLAAYSALISVVTIIGTADPLAREQGLLHGFGGVTWAVVLTQSLGGILVAVCIKYAVSP